MVFGVFSRISENEPLWFKKGRLKGVLDRRARKKMKMHCVYLKKKKENQLFNCAAC